ncbi:bifunctional diaminohydroxyphosphoribosylaminopyrimidine deaminase/5-amino-6-(5-phosphoribosylamino)uracil reductase RibD [Alkaliphilus hydrothermalis]|uniref:Riboflavin biosynthesis protein RibD n=1 Tax=Alkaliphilus hydrothermalis TaxID=1482730 RepID=A0ABS2NRV6_9FIRM|nr:bifunctional diaminohydroxyphosphoribosylaminopyrimidine deaminase/5-amino-6-(5-phosphoribosylamino)uracil reductase RibD [Alkaliphilus hydrothermalis]MBM7615661.1 diaminohydroxyphosphoribosylaminopyrimidine deaminase/5-amino-6-(5-phosphoribosylamino)uracil reductase [Alkaliphilus hydrothermalis]
MEIKDFQKDKYYMEKVLQLARQGWGKTRPNPLVGAVIVQEDEIIAEGYHQQYGEDHAEVDALKKLNFQAEGATIYVNLEPCSHYGKTPPCVEAIIRSKIARVVVGMKDPNPLVAGRGINLLREQGIEVATGVMEEEAKKLNEIFVKYITTQKPFVILKTAMTLDGKIATATGDSKWITNEDSRAYVHHIRDRVAGIMVGVSTIIKDNPTLNTRIDNKEVSQPLRIIVDTKGRTPMDSNVVLTAKTQSTLVATTKEANASKVQLYKELGVQVLILSLKDGRVDLNELMMELGNRQIDSVLLEGGGTLNFSALQYGIVDKVMSFIAPKIIGGRDAITPVEGEGINKVADAIELNNITHRSFQQDLLIEGYIEGKD